jgi:hypothetical protein
VSVCVCVCVCVLRSQLSGQPHVFTLHMFSTEREKVS